MYYLVGLVGYVFMVLEYGFEFGFKLVRFKGLGLN